MILTEDERKAIISLKLSKADKAYDAMLKNYEMGLYGTSANRLYYALYYACSALLVKDGFSAHTHSGVQSLIGLHYIKSGKIPSNFGRMLREAFRLRQDSDYDDYFSTEKEDLTEYISLASDFIELVKKLIM